MVAKGVFEDQAGARWYFLVREDLRAQRQHIFDGRQGSIKPVRSIVFPQVKRAHDS
jgi:hypothetical protein